MMLAFFIKLTVAEAMFAHSLKRRKFFVWRLIIGLAVVLLLQYGYDALLGLIFPESLPKLVYITVFLVMLSSTICVIYFSFDCSFIKAVTCGTGGYAVQNCIYYALFAFSGVTRLNISYITQFAALNEAINTMYYLVLYIPFFFWIRFVCKKNGNANVGVTSVIVSLLIVLTSIILSAYVPFGDEYILCYVYSSICSILAIAIQLGIFEKSQLKREMETIKQLSHLRSEQYKLFKECIETIDLKSHDLKQQINILVNTDDPQKRREMLSETQTAITLYDSMLRTGNETLDIVLTEKSLICEKNNILLSCMVDGASLDFMSATDIASLFGNALDNAIEGVGRYDSSEKRFINLYVGKQGTMLMIHVENYCADAPKFKDGLPDTTKEDRRYHGFGMKSIRYVVEKYCGNMLINVKDDTFTLDILFSEIAN